jgi:hypothetical protein
MKGFLYVMSNPMHPSLLKIGQTSKDPNIRRSDLNSSGVPEEFIIEYYAFVEDYVQLELEVHTELNEVRYKENREFFEISVQGAVNSIRSVAGDRIEFEKVFYNDSEAKTDFVSFILVDGFVKLVMLVFKLLKLAFINPYIGAFLSLLSLLFLVYVLSFSQAFS